MEGEKKTMLNSFDREVIIEAIEILSKRGNSSLMAEIENICDHIVEDTPEYKNYFDALLESKYAYEEMECYKNIVWDRHKNGEIKDFENYELETLIEKTKKHLIAQTNKDDAIKKLCEKVIV